MTKHSITLLNKMHFKVAVVLLLTLSIVVGQPSIRTRMDGSLSAYETFPEFLKEIPILMYHVIGDDDSSLKELYVNPQIFAQQMDYLAEQGYNTITLQELHQHWQCGTPLPEKPIILTFDDGYRSIYTHAYPSMQKHRFRGVLFLYVNKFNYANSMTRVEVAELVSNGYEIGNHTYNHYDLTKLSEQQLKKEILVAQRELERLFNVPVTSFAYPAGFYNDQVVEMLTSSSHNIAVTTAENYSRVEQGLYTLNRVRISRKDGLEGFKEWLRQYEMSYDPSIRKLVKSLSAKNGNGSIPAIGNKTSMTW